MLKSVAVLAIEPFQRSVRRNSVSREYELGTRTETLCGKRERPPYEAASGEQSYMGSTPVGHHQSVQPCPSLGGDDGLPPVSPDRFEECREKAIAELQRDAGRLKVIAGLVLLGASIVVWGLVRRYELEPKDEGRVLPRREWE